MAKSKDSFTSFDTPYAVQPPNGSAEGGIDYGKVASIPEAKDPMGVMPEDAKQHNIGPNPGKG